MPRPNKIHTERLTVYMGKGLLDKLKELSWFFDITHSECIRMALWEMHERNKVLIKKRKKETI